MSDTEEGETHAAGGEAQELTRGSGQQSVSELLDEPDTRAWIKSIAATMAVVGVALGLLVFLMSAFGGMELTQNTQQQLSPQQQTLQDKQYTFNLISSVFQMAPFVAFGIAAVAGLLVGFRLDGGSRKAMVAAGAAALVGTVALVMLAEALAASQAPSFSGRPSYSMDYGQALINSLVFGVLAALMSAAGAWNVAERLS